MKQANSATSATLRAEAQTRWSHLFETAQHEAGDYRQQHTFSQQLSHDAEATGADRESHRHLSSPRHGSREQHTREIHARDQQHQIHDDENQSYYGIRGRLRARMYARFSL